MIRTDESLQELLKTEEFHSWVDATDPRHPSASWLMLGDWRHELIWVVLTNRKTGQNSVACCKATSHPEGVPMQYRDEGICEEDAAIAEDLAQDIWIRTHKELKL